MQNVTTLSALAGAHVQSTVYRENLFHVVSCASASWVGLLWDFLGDDALTDPEAGQKGALFTTEEMGVLLGNFAVIVPVENK